MAAIGNSSDSELINGRYRILYPLQEGGFGKTFLVEDTQLPSQRRCVLKMLKPVQDNPEFYRLIQDRFQREAAIQETLGEACQQIPRLHAHFAERDRFYLVEEWIDGDTLSAKVAEVGRFSEARVLEILSQLLPIVDIVHQHHIIHRDIKPDNIILRRRDGMPVLIDFGAVKESMAAVVDSQATSGRSIVVGTASYMAPEQSIGRPLYASDLYSLGLTAIYLLTGKSPAELNHDPHTGKVEWRSQASKVSASLTQVIDTATQMHPQDRFASAQEMLQVLQSLQIKFLPEDVPTTLSQTPLPETITPHPSASPLANPSTPQVQQPSIPPAPPQAALPNPAQSQPSTFAIPETVISSQNAYSAETKVTNPIAAASSSDSDRSNSPQSKIWLIPIIIGGGLLISFILVGSYYLFRTEGQPFSNPAARSASRAEDFLLKANAKYMTGDLKGAVENYSQVLQLNPYSTEAYFGRGDARGDLGELQDGLEDLNHAIRINPNQLKSYGARALIRQKLGDQTGAKADYQTALKSTINPEDYRDYICRGIAQHYGLGDYKNAIADYNQAISLAPKYASTYVNRGNARYALEDYKNAIADFDRAISLNPKNMFVYSGRGNARYALGDKKGAIADYDQAISIDPNNARVYNDRGNVRYALGDKKGAIADYDQAISIDPKYASVYNDRGNVRYALGDKKGAIADYDQAISIDPKYAIAYSSRGFVRYEVGDKKGSIADYSQVISIDPKNAIAYESLGNIRYELGAKQEAIADYQKAAALYKAQGNEKNYQRVIKSLQQANSP
jgi:serine/threonine protein kinase/Tfp pilus assembly protein PilF